MTYNVFGGTLNLTQHSDIDIFGMVYKFPGDRISVTEEMNAQWDIPLHVDTSLAAFVRGVLPAMTQTTDSSSGGSNNRSDGGSQTSADKRHHSGDGRHMPGTVAVSIILSYMHVHSYNTVSEISVCLFVC